MRFSSILALAFSSAVAAAPTESSAFGDHLGTFHVSNFNYTCPSNSKLCFWDFDVTDPTKFKHHPPITEELHCTGNSTMKNFIPGSCTDPKKNKQLHINGYVKQQKGEPHLNLQYVLVPKTEKGFFFYYMGNTTVDADSKKQPKSFLVNESSIIEST